MLINKQILPSQTKADVLVFLKEKLKLSYVEDAYIFKVNDFITID